MSNLDMRVQKERAAADVLAVILSWRLAKYPSSQLQMSCYRVKVDSAYLKSKDLFGVKKSQWKSTLILLASTDPPFRYESPFAAIEPLQKRDRDDGTTMR